MIKTKWLKGLKGLTILWLWLGLVVIWNLNAQEKKPTPEKIQLAWKWEKGKTIKYKDTTQVKQKMKISQEDMETFMNQIIVYSEKVIELDDKGVATIEVKMESIKIEQKGAEGEKSFDSTNQQDIKNAKTNPEYAFYVAFLSKPYQIKITKHGEILEVKGITKIIDEFIEQQKDKDDMFITFLKQLKKTHFNDETIKKLAQYSYSQLPKKEVSINDSWETSLELPLPLVAMIMAKGKHIYKNKETLGARECARIDTQWEITASIDHHNPVWEIFEMECGPSSGSGFWWFDLKEGIMVKSESKIKINLKAALKEEKDEKKEEMKIDIEMNQKRELVE